MEKIALNAEALAGMVCRHQLERLRAEIGLTLVCSDQQPRFKIRRRRFPIDAPRFGARPRLAISIKESKSSQSSRVASTELLI